MNSKHIFTGLIGLLTCLSLTAAPLPVAETDYKATRVIQSEAGQFSQTLYHSKGKERVEMDMEGMQMVLIQRPDKQLAWQLMPMMKMYSQISLSKGQEMSGQPPEDVQIELVGEESLDGQPTNKYKLLMKDKSGGGFIWFNQQNIPVKMDFVSVEGKSKQRISMTLKDIETGTQDPDLFELPAGYNKMPGMPGF